MCFVDQKHFRTQILIRSQRKNRKRKNSVLTLLRVLCKSALGRLGVHPYFLPQIARLFRGGAYNHNRSAAAKLYAATVLGEKD